jgi:nucleoside-diphosphate-sugar epimerase
VRPEEVRQWISGLSQPVAITGGTGFVGSHLVDTLCAAGVVPRVLVRDLASPRWIASAPVDWVRGSLEDSESLKRLVVGAGTVLHLAGVLRAGREKDFDRGNRLGTARLVAAIQESRPQPRTVYVSSLAAVGPSGDPAGSDPKVDPAPISGYGRSKLAAEAEVRAIDGDGWWCILRPPAVYGPRDTDVFEFFRMASRGLVAVPGGERWLTVAWVGDVVRATLASVTAPPGKTYHLGEPEPMRLETLIDELCRAGGVRRRLLRVPSFAISGLGAAGSVLQRFGLNRVPLTRDKARELLARHWTARTVDSMSRLGVGEGTRFPDGAAKCWQWYRQRGWLR